MKPLRVLLLNLREFTGYVDLTDFRDISPKPSRDDDKQKCVRKFHLCNTSRILLATPPLDADIETTNQNIEKA